MTELLLFGVRGKNVRTLTPGRRQVNLLTAAKRDHSRKPPSFHDLIEGCSPGPHLELFARAHRPGWTQWGDELDPQPGQLSEVSSQSLSASEGVCYPLAGAQALTANR